MTNRLWYKEPSKQWTDALPLGNGRIGAMVFGGTKCERISLNEETLWSGYPVDKNNKNACKHLERAKELAFASKFSELTECVEQNMLGDYTESYLPLGDMTIEFNNISEDKITDYVRELSLDDALCKTAFVADKVSYCRTAFVSHPDELFELMISADKPGMIDFKLSFDSKLRYSVTGENNCLTVDGLCPSHVEPSYLYSDNPVIYEHEPEKRGIAFRGKIRVLTEGGTLDNTGTGIFVTGADKAYVQFFVRSSYNGHDKQPFTEGRDYINDVCKDIDSVTALSYKDLLERHKRDYSELFDNVDFYIESDDKDDVPTDERLIRFEASQDDKSLYRILFQYGRYLLISSSRKGGLPANLQGIWNSELRAPWSSNYTLNINTEMNYWLSEKCNLSSCHEPLFDFIERLALMGETTAKLHYNASGSVSHHNSDIWCISNPVGRKDKGAVGYAYWCMSFGWLTAHLYNHFEYTNDVEFLKKRAFPMIKKATEFYLDVLTPDEDGYLIIVPSTSPENAFIKDGELYKISKTTTMTTAIVKEVFTNYLKCCEILSFDDGTKGIVADALGKLPGYSIGKRGNLQEWDEDYDDAEETHRHISHLYPLYPGNEITLKGTPKLAKACERTLEIRGDDGTGWSLGWKINTWARLRNGNHAEKLIKRQLHFVDTDECNYSNGGGTYRNMFDAHPPFQIDGNFAASAGIAEMLLQDENGKIVLLPALPDSWKNGYIKGLCAKGGICVDIFFKEGQLEHAVLHEKNGREVETIVEYAGMEKPVTLHPHEIKEIYM